IVEHRKGRGSLLLAIDIGNTHIKFGLFEGAELKHKVRLATDQGRTDDEYGVLLVQALSQRGLAPDVVDSAIVASVVPELSDGIVAMVRHCSSASRSCSAPASRRASPSCTTA